jgi:hypothetical protein
MSTRGLALSFGAVAMASACLATNPAVADAARALVTGGDIQDSSLTAADVADGSLMATEFAAGQVPRGPRGEQGHTGPRGPAGLPGVLEPSASFAYNLRLTGGADERVVLAGQGAAWKIASAVHVDASDGGGVLITATGSLDVRSAEPVGLAITAADPQNPSVRLNKLVLNVFEMGPGRRNHYQVSAWVYDLPTGVYDFYVNVRGLAESAEGGSWDNAELTIGDGGASAGWVAGTGLR